MRGFQFRVHFKMAAVYITMTKLNASLLRAIASWQLGGLMAARKLYFFIFSNKGVLFEALTIN